MCIHVCVFVFTHVFVLCVKYTHVLQEHIIIQLDNIFLLTMLHNQSRINLSHDKSLSEKNKEGENIEYSKCVSVWEG